MASTQSSPIRMELIAVGEKPNEWGDITNENLQMLEGATTSYLEISDTSTSQTLTVADYTLGSYHNLVYKFTGSAGAAITYNVPAYERPYIIHNSCGQTVTIKVSGQTGVTVATGTKAYVYCDGTDVRELVNNPASITGTQTLTNKTLTEPKFVDGGFIADANGNELIVMDTVTSAVNEVTVSNAASPAVTATITIAAPAVVTVAATPASGTSVVFTSTGTLPTGIVSGTTYYVKYINATTFNIAATTDGTSITTSGTQSGTHTATFTGVPIIAASGGGTNVSINISPKGSGVVQANGVEVATLTGTQTLTNKTLTSPTITSPAINTVNITGTTTAAALKVPNIIEDGTYGSLTWASTINYDVLTQSVWYVTTTTSTNWTLNIRGSSTATLNSLIANVGEAVTINMTVTNGSYATTSASGTGTTATIGFAALASAPPVGSIVTISGVTPTTYNGTFTVTASTTTSLSYTSTATGAQTVAGIVSPLYYNSAVTIDGVAVTPKWQGGSAPTAGSASASDSYSYTIIKTSSTPTYIVLASKTKFN